MLARPVRGMVWSSVGLPCVLACSILAAAAALARPAAAAAAAAGPAASRSGLPWTSGVFTSTATARALEVWRGRPLDVETVFFGYSSWAHMISSAAALKAKLPTVPGQLVVALGMVPRDQVGKLAECAAGQFDPFIWTLKSAMLANGGLAAAAAGRPIVIRLGWEANAVDGGFPWQATGDGGSWRDCFRRWVDILNPVTDASATPPARTRNFVLVWNMANRGTFRYPIDNIWPGDEYVDVVGSQFYDRCPPLPEGGDAEWLRRLSARDGYGNPAGPLAWLNYARGKGKPYAMPEWGVGGPSGVCARPGVDNPYFIRKMYEFFQVNAADLAFESYFNGHGFADDSTGSCKLFAPDPAFPDPASPDYLAYVQRYNPNAAATYRALWGQDLSRVTPELSVVALDGAAAEGQAGATPLAFAVTRTGDPGRAVSVGWRVAAAGPGLDGEDFADGALPSGTVSLEPGVTGTTVTVSVRGDLREEGDEAFAVTLSDPSGNAALGDAVTAAGAILNDDVEAPVLAVAAAGADRPEGDDGAKAFTFVVTRTGGLRSPVDVSWQVGGGGVDAGDFPGGVLPSGTVGLAPNRTSRTVTVLVQGDAEVEPDETFDVTLSAPSGIATIATATATGTIRNDDAPAPALSVAAVTASRPEGNAGPTVYSFAVTRSGGRRVAVGASWRVTGLGADAADFVGGTLPSGTVGLAAGQTRKTVTVAVQGDRQVEPDETFALDLTAPTGGASIGTGTALATIANDDADPPVLSIAAADAARAEGDDGAATPLTFAVARTGDPRPSVAARWRVTTARGGAAAGDFQGGALPSGTVALAAGETSATVTVWAQGDPRVEPDEGFAVVLAAPTGGASLGVASASGSILNDDVEPPVLAIAAADASKAEGSAGGATPFTFAVTRSGDAGRAVGASWAVAGGTADPADFADGVLPSGTVSFAAGETAATVTVPVLGDAQVEPDETFGVVLSAPTGGALLGASTATALVRNDDADPTTLSVAALDAAKAEGDGGTTAFTFVATRAGDRRAAVGASWTVAGPGADAADFAGGVLPAGTLRFAPGETSRTLTVRVRGDRGVEPDEGFAVALSAPTGGATIAVATAPGTILNDDAEPPVLSLVALSAAAAEGSAGATAFTFAVDRAGDARGAVGASWRVVAGGGADAADFVGGVLPAGTVGLAAGETGRTITVLVQGDRVLEPDEGFAVVLSAPTGGASLGAAASASGTILNDDAPPPPPPVLTVAALAAGVPEGNAGATSYGFVVTRAGDAGQAVGASWRVAAVGGGADPGDFVGGALPAGTVSLAAGETSKTFAVLVQGDVQAEPHEAFGVALSAPTGGAAIGGAPAAGTILDDDPAPSALAVTATSARKPEGSGGATPFLFAVTRTGNVAQAIQVDWTVAGAGARPAAAADFVGRRLPSGRLSFAAGETRKTVAVAVAGDARREDAEGFALTLLNPSPGAALRTPRALGTILNDDRQR